MEENPKSPNSRTRSSLFPSPARRINTCGLLNESLVVPTGREAMLQEPLSSAVEPVPPTTISFPLALTNYVLGRFAIATTKVGARVRRRSTILGKDPAYAAGPIGTVFARLVLTGKMDLVVSAFFSSVVATINGRLQSQQPLVLCGFRGVHRHGYPEATSMPHSDVEPDRTRHHSADISGRPPPEPKHNFG